MKTFVKILSMLVAVIMLAGVGVVGFTAYAEPSDVLGDYDFTVVDNPYKNIQWDNGTLHAFKASTHAHTVRSDADIELNDTIWEHYMKGYEVLCLTDHGTVNGVDIDDAISGRNTGARYENGWSCGWTENQDRCALYSYQSFVHGNIDEITESDYYQVIQGIERNGRPASLVKDGRGMFNLPLGNEANAMSGNKCHVNTYNVSVFHGASRNVEWPESTVAGAYNDGAFSRINHIGEWTDGNGNPSVYNASWIQDFVLIFTRYCPNRTTYTTSDNSWNTTNVTGQRVKKGVIGIELVNTSDNRTHNDRFYVYDESLKFLAPQGINMYGFCEDDSHEESDVNKNAQYFLVNDGTAWSEEDKAYYGQHYGKRNNLDPWVGYTGDITRSMTMGEFYACSVNSKNSYELGDGFVASGAYPALSYFNIDENGSDQITLKVSNASRVRLVADGNIIATKTLTEKADAQTVTFDLNTYETKINSYIRIYMTGKGGITYLQPILLSKTERRQASVQFILPATDTTLEVYDSTGAVVNTTYTDNIYVLPAGNYTYTASRKGYLTKENEPFTVTQEEIDNKIRKTITVELEKDTSISQAFFYAPETIYLDPADNKTFKYYVDRENEDNGELIVSPNKTTGNVYFHRQGASDISITGTYQEGAASLSICSLGQSHTDEDDYIATEIVAGSLSSSIPDDKYVLIVWKAEYTYEGKEFVNYTYSYVYPAPSTSNQTLSAGGIAETQQTFWGGWNHSTMRVVSSVFVYGVHAIASNDTNGYAFAPYYYTGDTPASSNPRVSGTAYAWGEDIHDGGGSGSISPTGGTGYIYADMSRIDGFEDVPLFTLGMDINDAEECTGEDGGESYATLDLLSGNGNVNFLNLRNQGNLEQYSGRRMYQLNNAVNNNYTISFGTEENVMYTLRGEACGTKSSRSDKVISSVYINVIQTNKQELRRLFNQAVSTAYQQDWFENPEEYIAYTDKIIGVAKVLGNPAATPDMIDEATNNLLGTEVQLKSGKAQVKHFWLYDNKSGEIQVEQPYDYTLSDVLVANSTEIPGFTYANMYDRIVDGEIVKKNPNDTHTGSATFEKVESSADNYTWIFYYRPNTYDITYYTGTDDFTPEGGSGRFALYNQNFTLTTSVPSRSGYTFQGWYLDIDPTFKIRSKGETIQYSYMSNGQFIAKWQPLTYSVNYELHGGSFKPGEGPKTEELSVVYDQTYTISTHVPEKEGYHFVGWKTSDGEIHSAGSQFPWVFARDGTLEAQWSNIDYQVTFDTQVDDATVNPSTMTVYYDKEYGTLATANRAGYSYQWYSDPNCQDSALVTAETIVKIPANHTLFAKWTPIDYTITYNLDGGAVAGVNPITYNIESDPIELKNPTRTGYTFVGWSGTDIDSSAYEMNVVIPTGEYGNREYKANWKANVYTITYDLGAPESSASQPENSHNPTSFTYADNITIQPPTRSGYTFTGWTGDIYSNMQTINISAGTVAKDLTFTASWNIITYEIEYDFNGGTAGANKPNYYTVEDGFVISDPDRGGYEFAGWQSEAFTGLQKNLSFSAGDDLLELADAYGNISLTAIWSSLEGSIIYELYGGIITGTNPTKYNTGDSFIITNPTKTGYDFKGWDKFNVLANHTDYGLKETGIVPTDTGTIIFTARWTPTLYKIEYDLDGGHYEILNTGNLTEYHAETDTFTLTNPIKEGYIFAGWEGTDLPGATKTVTIQKGSTGARFYKAKWTAATYTITYDYAGGASNSSHINSYTFETESREIDAPTRSGYKFLGWSQTFQNFTWKPGELDAEGYYSSCDKHYLSSPILVRSGYTYTMDAVGDLSYINAFLFDEDRNFVGSVNVGDSSVLQIPNAELNLDKDRYFIYFVVSDDFLSAALRDTITIGVVDESDEFASTGRQKTVAVPKGSTGNFKLVADWEVETYNISYDLADGYYNQYDENGQLLKEGDTGYVANYNPNPTSYTVESSNILIKNPVKDGYNFYGWNDGTNVVPSVIIKQGSTGDRHYTAIWNETMYSISYELNNGVLPNENPVNYYKSTATFTLNNPVRTGYSFGGWTGTGIEGASFEVTIKQGSTGNRTYTATWTPNTYNISYVLNGGTNAADNPNTYTFETETFTLAHPTKAGAVFTGWTGTGLNSSTMTVTINQGSTDDRVYTANWQVSSYTISYNLAGGTNHQKNPVSYTVDSPEFTLEFPTRTGYSFEGWTGTGISTATKYVTINQGSTGNRNYTATWSPVVYSISYILGSGAQVGVANPTSYTVESPTVTLNNPTRPGYTFDGWSGTGINTENGYAKTVTIYKGSTGTRNYTANWSVEEYRIEYILHDDNATHNNPTRYTVLSPDIVLTPPSRTGYEFVAWSGTGISGTGFAKEVTIPTGSSGNRTYTANWELVEYNITYDLGEDAEETIKNPVKYNYLTAQITLHSPVKPGYDFIGWIDASDETQTVQLPMIIPTKSTGNKHFIAVWKEGDYEIEYNLDGGNWGDATPPLENYKYETETIVVPQPVKEGYVFAGWSGTGISGTTVKLEIPKGSTGDRTYKAHWAEGENKITYDLKGGVILGDQNPVTYVTGSGDIVLINPTKSGYRFAGWIGTNLSGPTKEVIIDTTDGGALEFTATWTPISYRISYTLGGGSMADGVTNPTTYTVESENFTLNAPVRTGYTFKGWTGTEVDGVQPTVTVRKGSTGARSYTAVWEESVYKITYDYGAGSVDIANPATYTATTPTFALNNPTLTGYEFAGWSGTGIDGKTMTVVINKGSLGDRTYVANYTINLYTIKYLGVEGATFTAPATTYTAEDEITIPNPSKIGYIFKGWLGTGINGIATDVKIVKGSAGNRVYTAQWEAIKYTIDYELNSGRVSGVNATSYTIESADISVLNPGRAGFTFAGWTKTLKDFIWTNGTIDSNGAYVSGSGYWSKPVSLTGGETYVIPDGVSLAVYKADGSFNTLVSGSYTATEDCNCSVVVAGDKTQEQLAAVTVVANNVDSVAIPRGSMGNMNLEANWVPQSFTITYNTNGGVFAQGENNPTTYTAETPDFKLYNPTKTGYVFNGWTGTGLTSATKDVIVATGSTGNRNYNANWKIEKYTLVFDLDGGNFGSAKVPEYYTIDTPTFTVPIPVKAGNTFVGWVDSEGNKLSTITIKKGSTGAKSYTAQWSENQTNTHTFYYYGMNNTLIGKEEVEVGKAPVGVQYQIVIGYQFAGWSVNISDQSVINNAEDVHVYSTYKIGPDLYDVTVWLNGTSTTTKYSQYASVKVTAAATSNGDIFSYWAVADEEGNPTDKIVSYNSTFNFVAHSNIILVAVYGAENIADKVVTRITKAEYDDYHRWISFYSERSVASGYTVLQHGILFTADESIANNDADFAFGTSGVYASTASSTSRNGIYTLSIGGLTVNGGTPFAGCEKLYARSYIKYVGANGNEQMIYSEIPTEYVEGVNCYENLAKNAASY